MSELQYDNTVLRRLSRVLGTGTSLPVFVNSLGFPSHLCTSLETAWPYTGFLLYDSGCRCSCKLWCRTSEQRNKHESKCEEIAKIRAIIRAARGTLGSAFALLLRHGTIGASLPVPLLCVVQISSSTGHTLVRACGCGSSRTRIELRCSR